MMEMQRLAEEMRRHQGVHLVGRTETVHEAFYAITGERRISHPAVLAVTGSAPNLLAAG